MQNFNYKPELILKEKTKKVTDLEQGDKMKAYNNSYNTVEKLVKGKKVTIIWYLNSRFKKCVYPFKLKNYLDVTILKNFAYLILFFNY